MKTIRHCFTSLIFLFFSIMVVAQEDAPGRIPVYPVPYEYPTVEGSIDFSRNSTYHFLLKSEWPDE